MRHQIFFILFAAALLPHTVEIPNWVLFISGAIALHAHFALSGYVKTLSLRTSGLLSLLALTIVIYQFRTILGPEPATALLIILAALKLEELRSNRDGLIFLFLIALLVMYYLLFSQTILATLYMLAMSLSIMIGFIIMNTPREHLRAVLKSSPRLVSKDLLLSLPIFIVMFAFFPRFSTPWASLLPTNKNPIGFSDTLAPGQMAELAKSKEPAFHVTFENTKRPAINQMYWRGVVLDQTDGWNWQIKKETTPETLARDNLAQRKDQNLIQYNIQIEPRFQNRIFTLESPTHVQWSEPRMYNPLRMSASRTVRSEYPVVTRLQYEAASNLNYKQTEALSPEERNSFLKIPPATPQMNALISTFKQGAADPQMLANNVLNYFARERMEYSLTTPEMSSVDDFIFNKKVGFCEHFASAFAAMMRWAGVPSRVVSGFQGGEVNTFSGFILVRDQHAHTWSEIHDGEYWVRIDPTTAINSIRIAEGSLESALPLETGAIDGYWGKTFTQMQMAFSALEQKYTQFMLNYNSDAQEKFLNLKWGPRAKRWLMFGGTILIVALCFLGLRFLLNMKSKQEPIRAAFTKIKKDLQRLGFKSELSDGPQTVFQKAAEKWPNAALKFKDLWRLYSRLKYENDPEFFEQKSSAKWGQELRHHWADTKKDLTFDRTSS